MALLALGLAVMTGVTAPAAASASCAPGNRVSVDLQTWRADLLASQGEVKQHNAVLARLRLPEVWCAQAPLKVSGIDVFEAPLLAPGSHEQVVQVRYEHNPHCVPGTQRIQILQPIGTNEYCAIGSHLSVENEWCNGKLPLTFGFVNVLTSDVKSLEVKRCDVGESGVSRGIKNTSSYWHVFGGQLTQIFEVLTELQTYNSPMSATERTEGAVQLDGGFPKEIVYKVQHQCLEDFDVTTIVGNQRCSEDYDPEATKWSEPLDPCTHPCDDDRRELRFRFDGKHYAQVGEAFVSGDVYGPRTDGKRDGKWTFGTKGHKLAQGVCRKGHAEGAWTFWSAGGKLVGKGSFSGGKKEGVWWETTSDDQGSTTVGKGSYKDGFRVELWELTVGGEKSKVHYNDCNVYDD